MLGSILLDLCAPELAREQLEAAHEIARALGSRVWIRWIAAPLALARMQTSDVANAGAPLDEAAYLTEGPPGAPEDSTPDRALNGTIEPGRRDAIAPDRRP